MRVYHHLQRVPRATWVVIGAVLYVLLHVLGAEQVAVDGLPGRESLSKLYHVIFYAGLASLCWLSMRRPTVLLAVGLTFFAGLGDEWHQSFSAFRHARMSDVAIDTAAGLAAVLLLRAWQVRCAARATLP